jgi:5-methoxy-6-methylbenzimidazole methyltransferase
LPSLVASDCQSPDSIDGWEQVMRVALVSAPYDTAAFRIGENLGIKYLAAVLRAANVPVDVYEPALAGLDNAAVATRLSAGCYDVVGLSVMFDSALPNALEIARLLHRPGGAPHITLGGHVPTFNDEVILQRSPEVDTIVRFEGEQTLVELLAAVHEPGRWGAVRGLSYRAGGRVVSNPPRPLIADLDSLPYPVRDETSRHLGDPHYFVVTTRGCPFVCTFCSIPAFYKTPPGAAWRARSIDNVLDELESLVRDRGATAISFLDDEFLVGRGGKRRAIRLAEGISARRLGLSWSFECRADDVDAELFRQLKAGGLRHVFIGVESGVQRVLDTFDKQTTVEDNRRAVGIVRGLGLSLAIGFIMFDPYTTVPEILENVRFLRDLRIGSYKAVANRVLVYSGTALHAALAREGRLRSDGLVHEFDFVHRDVARIHRLVVDCLRPIHEMDTERRRLEFRIDNTSAGGSAAGRLRGGLDRVDHDANADLAAALEEIVSAVAAHPDGDDLVDAAFARSMHDRVAARVSARRSQLRALRSELEAAPQTSVTRSGQRRR